MGSLRTVGEMGQRKEGGKTAAMGKAEARRWKSMGRPATIGYTAERKEGGRRAELGKRQMRAGIEYAEPTHRYRCSSSGGASTRGSGSVMPAKQNTKHSGVGKKEVVHEVTDGEGRKACSEKTRCRAEWRSVSGWRAGYIISGVAV